MGILAGWKSRSCKSAFLAFSTLLVVGCSDQEEEEKAIDYASFDDAALTQMFEDGRLDEALAIIWEQRELGIADKADHLLAASIFIRQSDPVAAEAAVERAVYEGAEQPETALLTAKAKILKGDIREAQSILQEAKLNASDAFEALLLLGDTYSQMGVRSEARYYFGKAIEKRADDFRGYVGIALMDMQTLNIAEAEQNGKEAQKLNPDDPIVLYILGTIARYRGELGEAETLLNQAIIEKEGHIMAHLELASIYIEKLALEQAERELDQVYAIAPDHTLAYYYSALLQAARGDLKDAEGLLLRMGEVAWKYPPATRVLGHVAYNLKKFTTARPYLEKFLTFVPGDRPTRLALAESLNRRGESRLALEYLQPLLGEGSLDVEAMLLAASANGRLGEIDESRKMLQHVQGLGAEVALEPVRLHQIRRRLAFANFLAGDFDAAVSGLSSMIEDGEDEFINLTLLANLQQKSGEFEEAIGTANRMLELAPDSPVGHNVLSSVYYQQRQFDAALEAADKAVMLNENYASALKNKGLTLIALNKYEDAVGVLRTLNKLTPQDAHVEAMLGRSYWQNGQIQKAIPHLTKAEQAFPDSAIIKIDHAGALADLNYFAAAISKAKEARRRVGRDKKLLSYIDDVLQQWDTQLKQVEAEETAERDARRREVTARQREYVEQKAEVEAEEFAIRALRNELLAKWLAVDVFKFEEAAIDAYVKALQAADLEEAGEQDLIRKILADLEQQGVEMSVLRIETALREQMVIANRQYKSAQEKAPETG
jgi:tetratricopeptide (TPR) repeat protein